MSGRRAIGWGDWVSLDVECWFCGKGIEQTDREAIEVRVMNLWTEEEEPPMQYFFAHSICAAERLQGSTMKFNLDVFTNPN